MEKGPLLRRAREGRKLSRRELAQMYRERTGTGIHEMTLYRYEEGKLPIPQDTLQVLATLVGAREELIGEPPFNRPLVIAVAPYHDVAFLRCVAGAGLLEGLEIPKMLPSVRVKFSYKPWSETLAAVAGELDVGQEPAADIGLVNEMLLEKAQAQGHFPDLVVSRGVVEYRGYALLSNPPSRWAGALSTFDQHVLLRAAEGRSDRIANALASTILQIAKSEPEPALCIPAGTDMADVFMHLVRVAAESASGDTEAALRNLQRRCEGGGFEKDEGEAFSKFMDHLGTAEAGPAVYLGGLYHRLAAEQRGAVPLMEHDEFAQVAALHPELKRLFTPRNVVVIRRATYESAFSEIEDLRKRWDETVGYVSRHADRPGDLRLFGTQLNLELLETAKDAGQRENLTSRWGDMTADWEWTINRELLRFHPWVWRGEEA